MKTGWLVLLAVAVTVAIAAAIPVLAGALAVKQVNTSLQQQEGCPLGCAPDITGKFPKGFADGGKFPKGFASGGLLPKKARRVEVSSEYTSKVLSVLKSDPNASKLLEQGYNVTVIKPLITAIVQATGDVSLKAKQAVVILKGPSGHATALVDVEQGKVLKIVTVTRTVISKE